MNKFLQWIIGISLIVIVATFAISTLVPVFVPSLRGTSFAMPHQGMMGDGGAHMFGGGGMGGFQPGGMMGGGFGLPFFGFGMFLWPVLFIGAAIWGVAWLVRNTVARPTPPAPTPAATQACAHCGQPLQAGWKACPYCGEKVQ